MNQEREVCKENTMTIVQTLEQLGFITNRKKSVLIPTQRLVFFGFIIDSVEFKIFLTEEKLQKIILCAKKLLEKKVVIIRDLASFIGLIINAFYAVFEAPLHYRALERNKVKGLGVNMNFDDTVVLSDSSTYELKWWLKNVISKNGKKIRPPKVSLRCRTDASLTGWGAIDMTSKISAQGRWSATEASFHINHLELLAMFFALQSLYSSKCSVHIEIQSDNVSAVSYCNDFGGMASEAMDSVARMMWNWCIERDIHISAVYIPGCLNTADFFSRNFSESTEWMLKRDIFVRVCKNCFTPDIDLFASRLSKQLDRFVSWFPEPGASFYNAFTIDWSSYKPYLFPPFNLVGKVVNKLVKDEVEQAILIFPLWPAQSWFPLLLECISSFPMRLPRHKDLLTLPYNGNAHPLCRRMKIIAVEVSGWPSKVQAFREKLQRSSLGPGVQGRRNNIDMLGTGGALGVIQGQTIPFIRLKP